MQLDVYSVSFEYVQVAIINSLSSTLSCYLSVM